MPNFKPEGTQRVSKKYSIDPENIAYIAEKGLIFKRGNRSGDSEALNRMIKFCRDFAVADCAQMLRMALGRERGDELTEEINALIERLENG